MYPIMWKAEGRRCLIAGGGHVALRKAGGLLEEGALVTVVAPEADAAVAELASQGRLIWDKRRYRPGEGRAYAFLFSASGDEETARAMAEDAAAAGALFDAADFPALGNCVIPARIRRGRLTVAVSTGGLSPAFSKEVKHSLEDLLPEAYGDWLERLASLRELAKHHIDGAGKREEFWRLAFGAGVMALVKEGRLDEAEEIIRHEIGCFGTES